VSAKKEYLFKFPKIVGPFIVNNRQDMEEVNKMLQDMQFQQGDKWSYDPHQDVSKRRVDNSYAPYIHESRIEIEKMANGGQSQAPKGMEFETPHYEEKGFKRGIEEVIDLDDETSHSSKISKLHGKEKESEPLVEISSSVIGFKLNLGESRCTTSSPIPE